MDTCAPAHIGNDAALHAKIPGPHLKALKQLSFKAANTCNRLISLSHYFDCWSLFKAYVLTIAGNQLP